jgi:hypothetical protein
MAISFVCPDCKTNLTFPDQQGGERVSCFRCGVFLTIPHQTQAGPNQIVPGAPPQTKIADTPLRGLDDSSTEERSPYEEPGYDRGAWLAGRFRPEDIALVGAGWNLVRIGLAMMYWSLVALLLAGVAYFFLALLILGTLGGRGMGPGAAVLGIVVIATLGVIFVAFIVMAVGQCMCCTAPPESGAKGLAVGSAICLFLSVAGGVGLFCLWLGLASRVMDMGPGAIGMGMDQWTVLVLAAVVFMAGVIFVGHVLFVLFLRAIGRYFQHWYLAQGAGAYLTAYCVYFGVNLFIGCIGTALGGGALLGCLSVLMFILALILLIWYVRLLAAARETLTTPPRR